MERQLRVRMRLARRRPLRSSPRRSNHRRIDEDRAQVGGVQLATVECRRGRLWKKPIAVGSCWLQLARHVISRVCLPIIGFTALTRSMSPPSFISPSISWYIRELTTCGCVGLWLDNQMILVGVQRCGVHSGLRVHYRVRQGAATARNRGGQPGLRSLSITTRGIARCTSYCGPAS